MNKIEFSVQVRLVSNLEKSKQFYEEILGCDVTDFWAVRDDFALGFKLLEAESADDIKPNKTGKNQAVPWDTYAYVETHGDLDELYEEFKGKGARIIQEPVIEEADWGDWKEFVITDPDNYAIAFGSGKKN